MLKKLRIKFICINMVIVAVMLCIIFGMVIHFTGQALENDSIRMMQLIGSGPPQLQRPVHGVGAKLICPHHSGNALRKLHRRVCRYL